MRRIYKPLLHNRNCVTMERERDKKGKFVGNKIKSMTKEEVREYNRNSTRRLREKLSREQLEKRKKASLAYYYKHREEHKLRQRKYYKKTLSKQKLRNFSLLHKKELLTRFGYKCSKCGKGYDKTFEFHHIDYVDDLELRFKDTLLLCKECHDILHQEERRKNW